MNLPIVQGETVRQDEPVRQDETVRQDKTVRQGETVGQDEPVRWFFFRRYVLYEVRSLGVRS